MEDTSTTTETTSTDQTPATGDISFETMVEQAAASIESSEQRAGEEQQTQEEETSQGNVREQKQEKADVADIARRERELRRRERELKAAQRERENEVDPEVVKSLKEDPISALKKLGFSLAQIGELLLKDPDALSVTGQEEVTDPREIARLEAERVISEREKKQLEEQRRANDEAGKKFFVNLIDEALDVDPESYDMVIAFDGQDIVFEALNKIYMTYKDQYKGLAGKDLFAALPVTAVLQRTQKILETEHGKKFERISRSKKGSNDAVNRDRSQQRETHKAGSLSAGKQGLGAVTHAQADDHDISYDEMVERATKFLELAQSKGN